MGFKVGDSVVQFVETPAGAMGMVLGKVVEVLTDKIVYITEKNEDKTIPDGEKRVVPVELWETLM